MARCEAFKVTTTGVFITFEGGEGTGKTTQIALLAERLRALGREVVTTLEPGGTVLGKRIRRYLVSESDDVPTPRAELLLYAADRAHHVEKLIRPALEAGKVVLCDRYADATEAYQGYGRGLEIDLVRALNRTATQGLMPHRTLLIDLDPAMGVSRSLERQAGEGVAEESRFEAEESAFHRRVREGYNAILKSEPQRVRFIDGAGTIEEVTDKIWLELADLFASPTKDSAADRQAAQTGGG